MNAHLFIVTLGLSLTLSSPGCQEQTSYQTKPIVFQSAQFEIVGDLWIPEGQGPHPTVIVVHGDGRGTRGYYEDMRGKFISAGFATFIWDKPGFGDSKGIFNESMILHERAAILQEAMSILSKQSSIDPSRIGVWGVSQAGYVIPIALNQGIDLAFMILVGAPAENSIEQTAYFVSQQVQCEGFSVDQVSEADSLAAGVLSADTYQKYVDCGTVLLDHYPLVKEIGFMAGILPEDRWMPRANNGESYFDPIEVLKNTTISMLVCYGDLDKNIDPVQGTSTYREIIRQSGNVHSRVVLFPNVDHDMVPSETGCMKERDKRWSWKVHPGYMDTMIQWLLEIE